MDLKEEMSMFYKQLKKMSSVLFSALVGIVFVISSVSAETVIKAHGISKFGDLKYPADFNHFDYINPVAPVGGEFSISAYGTFDSMNPYSRKGNSGAFASIFFESLLTGNADEVSSNYGLLAESIEYLEDRSWVIFHMRPEARFSDGTPLTAEDVAFSYELFLNEGLLSFRTELSKVVKSVEVIDPHTIKFIFYTEGRSNRDDISLVGGLPVFSKAWFEETGSSLDESRLEPAVGSGPYLLHDLDINKRLVYKRNPDYWGWDIPVMVGRYNYDQIRIEYFADLEAAFEGFKAGETTFRIENVAKNWATKYDFKGVENGWVVKRELPNGNLPTAQSWIFNLRRDKFQDIRVREALGLMFNFEWTNATTFHNAYERIDAFWENSHLKASGLPSDQELAILEPLQHLLPEEVFTMEPPISPSSNEMRRLDRRNQKKASDLLDAAGWTVNDSGKRVNSEGTVLDVEFIVSSATWERVAQPFIENLINLGVDARVVRIDPAQLRQREKDKDFDMTVTSYPISYEPGTGLRQYFGSEHVDGIFNDSGLADEAVDEILTHIIDAQSKSELENAVTALDRVLRFKRFVVFHWFKSKHTLSFYDMYEYPETIPPFSAGYTDFWWVNEDKHQQLVAEGALRQ